MVCYGFLSFCEMSHSALIPLIYSTPVEYGGLGFRPYQIGTIMGCAAILGGVMQISVFAMLMQRFGHQNMFTVSLWCMFIALSCFPIMSFFARRAGKVDAIVICLLVLQLCCASCNFMAYSEHTRRFCYLNLIHICTQRQFKYWLLIVPRQRHRWPVLMV